MKESLNKMTQINVRKLTWRKLKELKDEEDHGSLDSVVKSLIFRAGFEIKSETK